ncbi:MAG: hypothetical protein ACI8UO_000756 [Verrucomicrobiales bacterium]|jgi:hypothetical protein
MLAEAQACIVLLGSPVVGLLETHCFGCHDDVTAKGDLDLTSLDFGLTETWIKIHDRVKAGEMPPPDKAKNFSDADRQLLVSKLGDALLKLDQADVEANGRAPIRRLTREEYQNNLRDLLGLPNLDVRDRLPEDRSSHGYTKAAETLDMSRVQLAAYLDAAEAALREAAATANPPESTTFRAVGTDLFSSLSTFGGREAMFFARDDKMVPLKKADQPDPDLELAIFRSATWPYYGYPRGFRAKHDGEYRVRFSARAVRQVQDFRLVPADKPLAMTFRARQPSGPDVSGDVRSTGGWADILPEQQEFETTVLLKAGETFEYSLLGLPVPHPITSHGGPLYYDFPPMPEDGHPGVAIQWLEVEGPLAPPPAHELLFGEEDAEKLFRRFARLAARGPIPEEAHARFLDLIQAELSEGTDFQEAMIKGYQAFLCSGHFLYLETSDTASRLSHFLWNSRPDDPLPSFDDMIADPRFERFVRNFTEEWLDLRELRRDLPDIRLYPEYRKDDYLVESMERETRALFTAMIREDLPVTTLVDSGFVFANDKLTSHYDLPPVDGSAMRKVELPDSSPYGGLLTQASILKVTSNGTSTSPVIRGAWVMEKLLGDPPPPPPKTVPAIEPDLRGATTIQQVLAQHTADESCANCHARFDPVGFALENFDIMGAWRERYRSLETGEKITGIDRAGHAFEFRIGLPVEPAGKLRTGESFADIRELKTVLVSKPRQLARNLLHQFTLYGTGTPVRFSDRPEIETILDACEPDGYGVRDLLREFVESSVFAGS